MNENNNKKRGWLSYKKMSLGEKWLLATIILFASLSTLLGEALLLGVFLIIPWFLVMIIHLVKAKKKQKNLDANLNNEAVFPKDTNSDTTIQNPKDARSYIFWLMILLVAIMFAVEGFLSNS